MIITFENSWKSQEVSIIELSFSFSPIFKKFVALELLGFRVLFSPKKMKEEGVMGWGRGR